MKIASCLYVFSQLATMLTFVKPFSITLYASIFVASASVSNADQWTIVGSEEHSRAYNNYEFPFWEKLISEIDSLSATTILPRGVQITDDSNGTSDTTRGGPLTPSPPIVSATAGSDYLSRAYLEVPEVSAFDIPIVMSNPRDLVTILLNRRGALEESIKQNFGATVLAVTPSSPQIFFCNQEISTVEDFSGQKVAVRSQMQYDLLEAIGAIPVTMPARDRRILLERGSITCSIESVEDAYQTEIWTRSTHLIENLILSWQPSITSARTHNLERLEPIQGFSILARAFSDLASPIYADFEKMLMDDISCLTGSDECERTKLGTLMAVQFTESDVLVLQRVVEDVVLPRWAEKAGPEWVQRWNNDLGILLDIEIE